MSATDADHDDERLTREFNLLNMFGVVCLCSAMGQLLGLAMSSGKLLYLDITLHSQDNDRRQSPVLLFAPIHQ